MSSAPSTNEPWLPPQPGPPVPEPRADERPAWRPLGVLVAVALGLVGLAISSTAIIVVAAAFGADAKHLPSGVNVLLNVAQDGAFVLAAIYVASRVARPAPWQFGLRGAPAGAFLGWTLLAFFAFILASYGYSELVHIGKQEELPDQLGTTNGTLAVIVAAALVTVIAPLAEELFFRGFVFTSLRGRVGPWIATLVTGLFFGAIHYGSAPSALYLPILAIFGAVLCLLYWRTGSLYPCIVLHATNNTIAFGGTFDDWTWQYPALFAGSLACIALVALLVRRLGPPARVV